MRRLVNLVLFLSLSAALPAQPLEVSPTGVSGHHIGETAFAFLAVEPKARQDLDSCRQHSDLPKCDRLLAALEQGQRAEISTSASLDFVFDQGRLVKMATSVEGPVDALSADLTRMLGPRTSETDIEKQNASGAKWADDLSVWDAPDSFILLFTDNNPAAKERRPILVIESPAEHARRASDSAKRTDGIKRNLQKVLLKGEPDVVSLDF